MTTEFYDFVQQTVSGTPGTGTVTLGSAVSSYRALPSAADGKLIPGFFLDGTARETGEYLYTHSGTTLARTKFRASTTGSALSLTSAAIFSCDLTAIFANGSDIAAQSIVPGGRLTLTSGSPVPITDVSGATSIYYTPYLHNGIALWDGNRWQPVIFAELTLALGTLTSGKNYDVFGYLSAGALALEMLAWTNDSTRATAVTLQDGRYCKSGDKTRLLLGSFRTTSTTTTEDSTGGVTTQVGGKRFLWNMYNRASRTAQVIDTTDNWTYLTDTVRQANAAAGNMVEFLLGLGTRVSAQVEGVVILASNSARAAKVGVGIDSITTFSGRVQGGYAIGSDGVYSPVSGDFTGPLAAGYHYAAWLEKGADFFCTFLGDNGGDGQQTGLTAEIWG